MDGTGRDAVGRDAMGLDVVGLAETVAARLCHDLGGLAGTLMNALEMAEDDNGGEALSLSVDAGRALGGRLRLLRAAWGGPGAGHDAASLAELLSHAAGASRTRVDWSGCAPGPFPPALARLLLNVALTAVEALPRGGAVRVSGGLGGEVRFVLDGPVAAWPASWGQEEGEAIPRAPAFPASPRELQPALTLLFAAEGGFGLRWQAAEAGPQVLVMGAGRAGQTTA